jgi:tetratricopeptide (TPR) repeat protein
MLKPKKRIKKQDLKEDKFVKTTLQVKSYVDENYRQVVLVVGSVFAILIVFIIYGYISGQKRDNARSQLGIAQIEFTNGNFNEASKRLHNLVEEYKGSEEAEKGMFLLANIFYQQKNYEQAKFYFEEFIDSYSGSEILLSSGYAGLGACKEIESKFDEAAELYEEAAKIADDFIEANNYRYLAGICYKKAGQTRKAIELFKEILNQPDTSYRIRDAESQLVLLGEPPPN